MNKREREENTYKNMKEDMKIINACETKVSYLPFWLVSNEGIISRSLKDNRKVPDISY